MAWVYAFGFGDAIAECEELVGSRGHAGILARAMDRHGSYEFQTSRSSDDTSCEWIRTELESVDIGETRLNARVVRVMDKFWKQPQASIPKAMGSWSEAKAAYRLLNNPKVTPEKILTPHLATVRSRIEGHRVVLAMQDTTDLNFTSHRATEGLGTIGSSPTLRGMHVHTTLAVTPERLPP